MAIYYNNYYLILIISYVLIFVNSNALISLNIDLKRIF